MIARAFVIVAFVALTNSSRTSIAGRELVVADDAVMNPMIAAADFEMSEIPADMIICGKDERVQNASPTSSEKSRWNSYVRRVISLKMFSYSNDTVTVPSAVGAESVMVANLENA